MQLGYSVLQMRAVSRSGHSLSTFPFTHWTVITVQGGIAWVSGNSTGHTTEAFIHITAKPTEKAPALPPSGTTGEYRVYKVKCHFHAVTVTKTASSCLLQEKGAR